MNQGADVVGRDGHGTVQRSLWALTGVLGLTAWAVDLAATATAGFAVPLAVLAGAVAAVGLVPGQAVRGWLVVAVAVTAFTATTTTTVAAGGAAWGLIVVDVLVALQVVVAVLALLLESRVSPVTQSAPEGDYAAYAEYVRAYREYALQYESQWRDQYSAAGAAEAAGEARGDVAGTALGDEDAWADLQAKYARYAPAVVPSERTVRRAEGGDTVPAGMPEIDRMEGYRQAGGQVSPGSAPTASGAH